MKPDPRAVSVESVPLNRVLARHGLIRGPRLVSQAKSIEPILRLKSALVELGPTAVLFGRYLSTRMDLLAVSEAVQLQDLPLVAPSFGETLFGTTFFAAVDPEPCRVSFCWVAHRALTEDGRSVEVRWFDPERRRLIRRRLVELETGLRPVLAGKPWQLPADRLWAEFLRHDLEPRLDLRRQWDFLQRLSAESEVVDGLQVPSVDTELSNDELLVLNMPRLASATAEPLARRRFKEQAFRRRVAVIWIQLALTGGLFPVAAKWSLGDRGEVVFVDGTFAGLSTADRPRAWDYLRAVARREPDRALTVLGQVLKSPSGWGSVEEQRALRSRLRYAVPFRDGSWTLTGNSLAEMGIHQWRAFAEIGFGSPDAWCGFFRGLILRSRETSAVEPDRDALREALDAVQWQAGWNQLRQLTEPRAAMATAERYGLGFLELPQALDRLLDSNDPARRPPWVGSEPRSAGSNWARAWTIAGAIMGLASLAIALPTVAARWPVLEFVGAGVFGVLGFLMLALILRGDLR